MRCQFCGKRLPILRKLTDGEFCSPAHRRAYTEQQEQQALSRLLEASLGAPAHPKKKLAHPDAEALVVAGRAEAGVPGRPYAPEPAVLRDTTPTAPAAPSSPEFRPEPAPPPGCDRFFSTPIAHRAMPRPTPELAPVGSPTGVFLPEGFQRRGLRPAGFGLRPTAVAASGLSTSPTSMAWPEAAPVVPAPSISPAPRARFTLSPPGVAWVLARPVRLSSGQVSFRQRLFKVPVQRLGNAALAPWIPPSRLEPTKDWAPAQAPGAWAVCRLMRAWDSPAGERAIAVVALAFAPHTPAETPGEFGLRPHIPGESAAWPQLCASSTAWELAAATIWHECAKWRPDPIASSAPPQGLPSCSRSSVTAPLALPMAHPVGPFCTAVSSPPLALFAFATQALEGTALAPAVLNPVAASQVHLSSSGLVAPPRPGAITGTSAGSLCAPTQVAAGTVPRLATPSQQPLARTLASDSGLSAVGILPWRPTLCTQLSGELCFWPNVPVPSLSGLRAPRLSLLTQHELDAPPAAAGLPLTRFAGLRPYGLSEAMENGQSLRPFRPSGLGLRCGLPLRGAALSPTGRLLRLPFLWHGRDDFQLSGGSDQPMVFARPVPPRTVLRPDPARISKSGLAPDALRALPVDLSVPIVQRFWRLAPADLRWVALVIPVALLIGWYSLAPKKRLSDEPLPETPAATVKNTASEGLLDGYLKNFKAGISRRAAIELSDDFRSGLAAWEGDANWSDGWSYDQAGFVRPGALALLKPSLHLEDYTFEFLGKIDRRGLSWVFRAKDTKNYHLGRLVVVQGGPLPQVAFVRSIIKNGRETGRHQETLHEQVRLETLYRVRVDVKGNDFTTSVLGKVVDTYTDESYPSGGVGFLAQRGEESRIRWVEVSHQYDTIGRLCAWLAPNELTKPLEENGPEREKKKK